MNNTQLEKLKQLVLSDKTPEDIKKVLIDILTSTDMVYTYIPYPVPVGPLHYPYYPNHEPIITCVTW